MQYEDYKRIYGLTIEEYNELNEILVQQMKEEFQQEMEKEENWKNEFCDW